MASDAPTPPRDPRDTPPRPRLEPLPLPVRIALHFVGWVLILIGIAGLALPGIQGIVTILAGAAVLSLASDTVHRWLHQLLGRWPRLLERLERHRSWFHRKLGGDRPADDP